MKNLVFTLISVISISFTFGQGDDCFNATPLGTLPAPSACPGGSGTTFTYNGTTNGATAENPYSSLACMDAPAADVWVTFVASGNEMDLDFSSGLNDANIGIYTGDCTTGLTGLFCETSNNGNISTTLSPFTPGETYYMQISGANETDFSNFTLDMTNYMNCALCVLESSITASPPPANGFYLPGTTVQFCLTITEYEQVSSNWIHSILPSFGSEWDVSTLTPVSSPSAAGSYEWIWTDPSGGDPVGWWVDYDPNGPTPGDGDPTNNFGDNGVSGNGNWTWCWEITTSTSCTPGGDLSISVNTTADGETGSWTSTACTGDPDVPFQAVMMCCDVPLFSGTDESCPGASDGTVSVTGQGGLAPYDYVFENSSGTVVFTQNNVGDGVASTATGLVADTYTVTVTDDNGCVQIVDVTIGTSGCPFPTFDPAPANTSVQCPADVPAMTNLVWNDPCMGTGSVPGVDVSDGNTCPETITRTWTFTNACGNSVSTSQTIIIDDTTPPTASNPSPINVECIGDVPASNPNVVTDEADNCTAAPIVAFVSEVSDGNSCPETLTRTYSITDDCGNSINVSQSIIIDDVTPPTASNPAPIVVQCIADVPASDPTVVTDEADNCSVPVVAFVSDASDGNTCPETITRTYSVTDACGNSINVTQTITVDDTQNPTASNPAPIAVQCIGDIPAADPTVVTDEADNCSVPVVAFVSDASDGNTCPETITRTYSVTDACGNSTNVTQTITVDDTQNPTASNPSPIVVQCIADVPASDPTIVTDEADNCSVPVVAFVSDASDGNTCPETITRTYSVTDACGNSINVTQTITVDDTQNPTASNPAPIVVQCIGDVPAADPTAVTDEADNCSVPVVAFVSDASDGNTCPETITRIYSVTDACGNSINVTQTITVDDTQNPTASNPSPIVVQCIADVPASDPTVVTDEADNCTAAPVVTFVSDVSDGNTCPETITRTYSITDACGNSINVTQTISVDDTQNPTASNPAPINTTGSAPAPDITVVTDEADNCTTTPVVAFVSDVSDGGFCPETITRTYSVTDDCGNQILVTQLITIGDANPPTASNPAPIAVECIGDVPAPDPTVVTDEADNSGVPVVAWDNDVSDGNTCPETITRTYSVTDDCGNVIFVTQTITVDDVTPPTASNPSPITVECIGDVPVSDITVVTDEADNCTSAPVVAFVSDVSDGNTCPETITRTYSVTDDCGNSINVSQTIIVDDVNPPTASNPAPVVVECIGDVPASDITIVTDEADNCTAAPVVAFVSDVSDGNTCPETITRTYSVTDDCGNSINVTQTITVDDVTPPTASNPAPVAVECIGDVPASDMTVVTDEADNCTIAPVVAFVSDVSDGNTCPETITRTYSVTDDCGNSINVTQTITVDDVTPPTASNPSPITVECIGDVPVSDITVVTDESDNCSAAPTVAFVSDVSDGNTCPETITRTYSVTDDCGNSINVTQTITVDDITPPTATNPAPVTIECIGDVPASDITVVTDETDNCTAAPVVAFVSDVSDGNTCPETITRTYSITDDCGNSITVTQTITVDDVTPPTGTAPADITVECIGDVPAVDPTAITDEADNCTASPVVVHVSDVSDGNTCPEVITRTYSITDDCGNVTTVTQTITVDDTTLPTASNPAQTIVPGGPAPAPDPSVVTDEADNCTANPVVAFVSQVSDGNACPETITYTYSVTDDCGNQILVTHDVLITDPILPTASNPAPVVVECIGDVPAPDPTVVTDEADNNGVPVVAWDNDASDGNTCPETITRTYSVTDDCGNVIFVTQTITVDDVTPPTGTAPANVTVECITDVPVADPSLIVDEADNCTAAPAVAFFSDVSDGNTCPEIITRTYSITDDCGNVTNVTQTITVDDVTPPTGTAPADVTVECIGDVPAVDPTAITDEADNCTAAPFVAHVSDVSDGNTCPEVITRTYSITDDCGNVTTVTQTITIDDTTLPTASNPAQTIVPGGPAPAPDPAVVTDEADNCTVAPVVAFVSQVSDGNACPETITYTYSVTDDCGNSINVTHEVLITDPIMPTASNPAPINVECIGDVPAPDVNIITDEADNNGVPIVAFVSDVSDGNTCPETITRTYSVTDVCGNQILLTQTITVNDVTPPTGTAPADVIVECIGDVPAPDPTLINDEADNCTANPVVAHVSDVSDGNTCPETISRTYSITDDCGNSINVVQTITVDDVTPPLAGMPLPINVECIGDVPPAELSTTNSTVVPYVTDNCTAAPLVDFVGDVSDGNNCPETITRTYSITDDCGNQTFVTQTITVNDITSPTASNPATTTVSCMSDVPQVDPSVVTDEADNCSANPLVAFFDADTTGTPCNGQVITRTYHVTDDCGNFIPVTHTINVTVTPPVVDGGTNIEVCEGTLVTLSANPNPSNASISWDNGIVDGSGFMPPAGSTNYTVTAEVCGGECIATDVINVTVQPSPTVLFEGDDLMGCEPHTVTFTNMSTPTGQNCQWNFGDGTTTTGCGTVSNTYTSTGTFDVTLTVISDLGCTSTATYSDYITVSPYPVASFNYSPNLVTVEDTEVEFENESLDADTYTWDFGDFSGGSNEANPTHTYAETGDVSYTVTLWAESDAGCTDSAQAVIYIEDIILFYVPNVFTPDGDSFNEEFTPVFTSGYDIYDYHLTIFNRWGEIVFESYNANYGWSGTYGDQGLVEDGVYVWQIEFGETMSDKRHTHRGHVTVLK